MQKKILKIIIMLMLISTVSFSQGFVWPSNWVDMGTVIIEDEYGIFHVYTVENCEMAGYLPLCYPLGAINTTYQGIYIDGPCDTNVVP